MADATLAERYHAARRDPTLAVIEGLHALKHAYRFGAHITDVRTSDPGALRRLSTELAPDVTDRIMDAARAVDADTFEVLAPAPHATGVIALARRAAAEPTAVLAGSGPAPVVLLERPTHHGNIGAVVRVAAAAGAAGVLVTGRHDPWHPSSIRGAAGLHFALPVAKLEADGLDVVTSSDRPLVALDPAGDAAPPPARAVLVFGSERTGVSEALLTASDRRISIPMRPGVSSLNLATAVAVTLYAAGDGAPF